MGLILHQVDGSNTIVTAVIVDKYGEVVDHMNFSKLLEPRSLALKNKQPLGAGGPSGGKLSEEAELRSKKLLLQQREEEEEHQKDCDRLILAVLQYEVDLIVVGANSLDARRLKKTLDQLSEQLKTAGIKDPLAEKRAKLASTTSSTNAQDEKVTRDVFVIWGNLEIPKLFANSHSSQKLHKSFDTVLRQATSLARFE